MIHLSVLTFLVGCDYTGDWLFARPTDAEPIVELGVLTPADVTTVVEVADAILYGEVGATGSAVRGGVTFSFAGTGGSVCVWVDPELAFFNQSVSALQPVAPYLYPDNVFDDGDLDLFAGFSVYYSGSPGVEVGNFRILYEDALGNQVPIQLNECTIAGMGTSSGGHAGRGSPEYCTLSATQPGVSYTVLMETWSTPLDDDILNYGLLLVNGTCTSLVRQAGNVTDECVITGEARPDPESEPYEGSREFEAAYCLATQGVDGGLQLVDYCENEAKEKDCDRTVDPDVADGPTGTDRCFCGDPADSPKVGGT